MLILAIIFFGCAVTSGILGFSILAGTAATVGKALFVVFLALFILAIYREKEPTE